MFAYEQKKSKLKQQPTNIAQKKPNILAKPVIQRFPDHQGNEYHYGFQFTQNHLSERTGENLRRTARSRNTTVVNQNSLEEDMETVTPTIFEDAGEDEYRFTCDINVEAYTRRGDPLQAIIVNGYDSRNPGYDYKITHLRAAE